VNSKLSLRSIISLASVRDTVGWVAGPDRMIFPHFLVPDYGTSCWCCSCG